MAYANANNVCSFLGVLAKDPEISTVGKGKNSFGKAIVTLAVPKTYNKNRGDDEPTADFPRIEFIGDGIVDYIENYFSKGKPASVLAGYKTFTWTDKNGETQYGQSFEGVAIQFVPGAKSDDDEDDKKSRKKSKSKSSKKSSKRRPEPEEDDEDDEDYEIDDDEMDEDIPF